MDWGMNSVILSYIVIRKMKTVVGCSADCTLTSGNREILTEENGTESYRLHWTEMMFTLVHFSVSTAQLPAVQEKSPLLRQAQGELPWQAAPFTEPAWPWPCVLGHRRSRLVRSRPALSGLSDLDEKQPSQMC